MIDKFAASFLINSALYIAMIFIAGLMWHHRLACELAIGTAASALLSADLAVGGLRTPSLVVAVASWLAGASAAIALLI